MRTRSRKQREDDFSHRRPVFLRLYRGRAVAHIAPGFAFSLYTTQVMCGFGFSEKGLTFYRQIWTIFPMNFPRIFLKTKEEIDIKLGQPWVFDNEIAFVKLQTSKGIEQLPLEECSIPDGSPVEVYSKGGLFLGTGIINRKSKITIRLISSEKPEKIFGADSVYNKPETIHSEQTLSFFTQKVKDALDARFLFYKKSDSTPFS